MRVIECQQYSPEWWQVRRGVPTASEFKRIITPKNWAISEQAAGYAHQLIADRYDQHYGLVEDYVSAAMRNGSLLEPEARRFYEFDRSIDVRQVGFCLTDDGRFGCSPDSLVGDDGALELKSPTAATHVKYLLAGGVPSEYLPQCHGVLLVTGRAWIDFMSYCPGLPHVVARVEADEKTEALRKALDQFWTQYQEMLERVNRAAA